MRNTAPAPEGPPATGQETTDPETKDSATIPQLEPPAPTGQQSTDPEKLDKNQNKVGIKVTYL